VRGFARVSVRTLAESVGAASAGLLIPQLEKQKLHALYRTSFSEAARGRLVVAKPYGDNAWSQAGYARAYLKRLSERD
jgi:hypothetical protein